jgi:sugar phosphate isomerase/epimerase
MDGSSRRQLLASTAVGLLAGMASRRALGAIASSPRRYPIVAFTKPFASLSFDATADLVAEVGWDGVELAVRNGNSTHITPERVGEDLPRMSEALRRRGKEIAIVTTSVVALDAAGRRVLEAVAAAGIPRVRLGFLRYAKEGDPSRQIAELRAALTEVAAACRDLGLRAGYQNHSGAGFVGAPIWDLREAFAGTDPKQVGICFDIGHATVEGGLAWPLHARAMADRLVAVFCKDFFWEKTAGGQRLRWCPLGEGVVPKAFFDWLKTTGYEGPISQHHEYEGLGTGPTMIAHFKRDLQRLREWLGQQASPEE